MKTAPLRTLASLTLGFGIGLGVAAATAMPIGDSGGPDTLNFEVRELTPDFFPISRNVYGCTSCELGDEQDVVLPAPTGWEIAATRLLLPRTVLQSVFVPAGAATSLDLIAGIPGDEYQYIATVLSGSVLQINHPFFGTISEAQVRRDTVMTYSTGRVVHELVSSSGDRYVLFTIELDALTAFGGPFDHTAVGGLAIFNGTVPGFTYESRVLSEDLVLASGGLANVLNVGGAAWQKIVAVPEPGPLLPMAAGLVGTWLTRGRQPRAPRRRACSRRFIEQMSSGSPRQSTPST